jgi:pentose-5-phosphate-3-epimerase
MIVVPAIYPEIFEEIADKLYALSGITKFVQIIISDGQGDMRKSWYPSGILPDSFEYEFDLHMTDWKMYATKAYSMSAKSVVVHVDTFTDEDFAEIAKIACSYKRSVGVAIDNETPMEVLINAVRKLEATQVFEEPEKLFIQVTGVKNETGNNREFDARVLQRITFLKKLFPTHPIQVSGRINPDNAGSVRTAGADRLVSNSYIFGQENLELAIARLLQAIDRAPLYSEKKESPVKEMLPKIVQTFINKTEALVYTPEVAKVRVAGKKYDASTDALVYEEEESIFTKE